MRYVVDDLTLTKSGSEVECSSNFAVNLIYRNLAKALGKTIAGAKKVRAEKEAKKQAELEERRAQGRAEKKGTNLSANPVIPSIANESQSYPEKKQSGFPGSG